MKYSGNFFTSKIVIFKTCMLISISSLLVSCGSGLEVPPLAQVNGVVTMNGEPVSGATVIFEPKFEAHPAAGGTNSEGKFTLKYNKDTPGAAIGEYTVRIFHYGDVEDVPQEGLIPEMYGSQSKLTATVKEGENDIPFDLKGKKKK